MQKWGAGVYGTIIRASAYQKIRLQDSCISGYQVGGRVELYARARAFGVKNPPINRWAKYVRKQPRPEDRVKRYGDCRVATLLAMTIINRFLGKLGMTKGGVALGMTEGGTAWVVAWTALESGEKASNGARGAFRLIIDE
jgi:hypothetical protein